MRKFPVLMYLAPVFKPGDLPPGVARPKPSPAGSFDIEARSIDDARAAIRKRLQAKKRKVRGISIDVRGRFHVYVLPESSP